MNIKLAAVNALQFTRKFGMQCAGSGTSGLVRLADGSVEHQTISWSRRGKRILERKPVTKEELAKYSAVGFLEDHMPLVKVVGKLQRVRGRTQRFVIYDDANFRQERNDFLLGYKGATFMEEGIVDPRVEMPADLRNVVLR